MATPPNTGKAPLAINSKIIDINKCRSESTPLYRELSYKFAQSYTSFNLISISQQPCEFTSIFPLTKNTGGTIKHFNAFSTKNVVSLRNFMYFFSSWNLINIRQCPSVCLSVTGVRGAQCLLLERSWSRWAGFWEKLQET